MEPCSVLGPSLPLCKFCHTYATDATTNVISAFTTPIFIRVFFVGNRFRPGPWNLGRLSIPTGTIASAFVILMVPILCFPGVTGADLTVDDMNWTAVVYGVPMLLVCIWWVVSARKWFKGPKVNVAHMMHGEEQQILEGQNVQRTISAGSANGTPEKLQKVASPST